MGLKNKFSRQTKNKKQLEKTNAEQKETLIQLNNPSSSNAQLKKSYFEYLTDYPSQQVVPSATDINKREIVKKLRHRIALIAQEEDDDLYDDDDDTSSTADQSKKSIYDTLLDVIDDYEQPAVVEIIQSLLESRFTIPLFTYEKKVCYLPLLNEVFLTTSNTIPNRLGLDTSTKRVAVLSCRNPSETQTIELLRELFNINTLHRNDFFNNTPTSQTVTVDFGVGFLGKKSVVFVAHVLGDFKMAVNFARDLADVWLVEDVYSKKGENTTFRHHVGKLGRDFFTNGRGLRVVLWKPSSGNKVTRRSREDCYDKYKCNNFIRIEAQYGNTLISRLITALQEQFPVDKNLKREPLSKINDQSYTLNSFGGEPYKLQPIKVIEPSVINQRMTSIIKNVAEIRASFKLQLNFKEQEVHEDKKRTNFLDEQKREEAEKEINECLLKRMELSESVGQIVLLKFFQELLTTNEMSHERVTKIRHFEQELVALTEKELEKQQKEIDDCYNELANFGLQQSQSESDKKNVIQTKYLDMKENYRNSMLHIEHVWRELSHLYVADSRKYQELPKLAAQHLMDGFPIELLDGDANLLNLPWLNSVFGELQLLMDESKNRIFVLSVMGIQSSGKSTLLNTMFGIKMKTSVGQCTRGINMQLIPVDGREEYDYILILDTEGTRSPDFHDVPGNQKRDNQMATLSILLADATIVVNPGENDAAIKEILPVVLLAYQGSKLAEERGGQMSSMMFFVYNRIDTTQKEKLTNIIQTLANSLTEAFEEVRKMAGLNPSSEQKEKKHLLFNRFQLDVSNSKESDVRILGQNKFSFTPPDNVPDSKYGEALAEFREHIHKRVTQPDEGNGQRRTWKSRPPHQLADYLSAIWSCICSADFNLQFANVVERATFDQLETDYLRLQNELTIKYQKEIARLKREMTEAHLGDKDKDLVIKFHDNSQNELKTTIETVEIILDEKFKEIMNVTGREKWNASYKERWRLFKEKLKIYWCLQLRQSFETNFFYEHHVDVLKSKMRKSIVDTFAGKNPQILETQIPSKEKFNQIIKTYFKEAENAFPPVDVQNRINMIYTNNPIIQRQAKVFDDSVYKQCLETIKNKGNEKSNYEWSDEFEKSVKELISKVIRSVSNAQQNDKERLLNCLKEIHVYLNNVLSEIECYDDGIVSEMLEKTDTIWLKSNLENIEFSSRPFAHIYSRAVFTFRMTEIQLRWEETHSVPAKLKKQSNIDSLWQFYQMASQGAKQVKLFACAVQEKFTPLANVFIDEIIARVIESINKQYILHDFGSIQTIVDSYVMSLIEDKNIKAIIECFREPKNLVGSLLQCVVEEMVKELFEGYNWNTFFNDIRGAIHHATLVALNHSDSNQRAQHFIKAVIEKLQSSFKSDSLVLALANFSPVTLGDHSPEEFKKFCRDELIQELTKQPCPPNEDGYLYRRIADLVIRKLKYLRSPVALPRCDHFCPLCGSMCLLEADHDPNKFKHDTVHQPMGLVGKRHPDTGALDHRSCADVRERNRVQVTRANNIHFVDWNMHFPQWEKPRIGQEWPLREYIFHHYQESFAAYYKLKPCAVVPPRYNRDLNAIDNSLLNRVPPPS